MLEHGKAISRPYTAQCTADDQLNTPETELECEMRHREPHEFLSPVRPTYRECEYCGERKSLVCINCGYCYECHPAIEMAERISLIKLPARHLDAAAI